MAERYENVLGEYPVQFRDVWRVGRHTFACLDLERPSTVAWIARQLEGNRREPTILYAEPPALPRTATWWRNKAAELGGPPKQRSNYDMLMQRLAEVAYNVGGDAFVYDGDYPKEKGGVRHRASFLRYGGIELRSWRIRNPAAYSGRARIHQWAFGNGELVPTETIGARYLDEIPWLVMRLYQCEGGLVVDPTMGKGATALAAEGRGWWSLGTEIDPGRMALCLKALHELTGEAPVKEGTDV